MYWIHSYSSEPLLTVVYKTSYRQIPWSLEATRLHVIMIPDSKIHGANMEPIWSRQDPGGPHVVPVNLAIWDRNRIVLKLDKHLNCAATEMSVKF